MRCESHITIAKERINAHTLARHAFARLESGRIFVFVGALGPPRVWKLLTQTALSAFEKGVGTPGLRHPAQLARLAIEKKCASLLGGAAYDVTLTAISVKHGQLELLSTGLDRIYVMRTAAQMPERLTPRLSIQEEVGLRGTPEMFEYNKPLEPGEVVLAGSHATFSQTAIQRVSEVFTSQSHTASSILANLMIQPASDAGIGPLAMVLRIE